MEDRFPGETAGDGEGVAVVVEERESIWRYWSENSRKISAIFSEVEIISVVLNNKGIKYLNQYGGLMEDPVRFCPSLVGVAVTVRLYPIRTGWCKTVKL